MSPPLVLHGWEIAFQPQLFALQVAQLKAEVITSPITPGLGTHYQSPSGK
jgi:hypothetical protein